MSATHGRATQSGGKATHAIGVVGAGISGLTAASRLARVGFDVRVFDKARGVGGRTSVRREGDLHFDHGAQYFTVRDERFREPVRAWMDAGIVETWQGRIAVIENGTVRSSESQTRYVAVPAMNAITKALSDSLHVTTRTRVASMTPAGDRWGLRDDSNRDLGMFDALIVALPATQAAELLVGLPALAQSASACQFAPCWAVMAAFETSLALAFDGAFVHDSPLSWIARNSSKPGRPRSECWVLHASPEWSAAHLEEAPETVCRELLAAMQRATGSTIPGPIHTSAHRWRYALPSDPLSVGCFSADSGRVVVCGDWCQGARIEGAYLSGLAAAEQILASFDVTREIDRDG
jgi:predicted NAD/FAD-dependent oxidoreductase